ncbi:MAG: hypothetical protein ABSF82_14960 [Candidatus Bathyarchaeia archaeon]
MRSSIRSAAPKYAVTVHPKVDEFITNIPESHRRDDARQFINDLPDYPSVLSRWDIEKVKGRESTYRLRLGRYRIAFVIDKARRTINVPDAVTK